MEEIKKNAAHILHKEIEAAAGSEPAQRLATICRVLDSGNFAVIRRIPEGLLPLTSEEQDAVFSWADQRLTTIGDDDVSDRDFIYHLLVSCGFLFDKIMALLQTHRTQSREILERLRAASSSPDAQQAFNAYFVEVAQALLLEERIPSRDRGRHMLMTSARTPDDWRGLAERFVGSELGDLRQGVLERFLEECRDRGALELLTTKVIDKCMTHLNQTSACGRLEAMYMHWMIRCQGALGHTQELVRTSSFLRNRYKMSLPRSVQYALEALLPSSRPSSSVTSSSSSRPPHSVESALESGWTIKVESGRQVVLVKDGKSVTLYRPKGSK